MLAYAGNGCGQDAISAENLKGVVNLLFFTIYLLVLSQSRLGCWLFIKWVWFVPEWRSRNAWAIVRIVAGVLMLNMGTFACAVNRTLVCQIYTEMGFRFDQILGLAAFCTG